MAGRGEVRFKLVAEVEQVKNALNEVKSQVSALGNELAGRLGPAGSILQSMGPAGLAAAAGLGAGVAAASAFAAEMQRVIDTAGQLNDLSAKFGVTTQAIQELAYAGSLVGVSQEAVLSSIGKLQVVLSQGNEKAVSALDKLGLSLTQLQLMAPEKQFEAVAGALRDIQNPTEQAGLAVALFGKSFREVMPLIKQDLASTREEAEALGAVWSGELVEAGDTLGDDLTRLSEGFKGLKTELVSGVVQMPEVAGALADLVEVMKDLVSIMRDGAPLVGQFFAPLRAAAGMARQGKMLVSGAMEFAGYSPNSGTLPSVKTPDIMRPDTSFGGAMGSAAALDLLNDQLKESEKEQHAAAAAVKKHEAELNKLKGTIRHTYDELVNMGPKLEEESFYNLRQQALLSASNITTGPESGLGRGGLLAQRSLDMTGLGDKGYWTRYSDVADAEVKNTFDRLGKDAGESFRSGIGSALDNLGSTIIGAIQGGGDVGRSIGAALGEGIGEDLGKALAKSIGGSLGKALGSLAGPLGALGGSLLGGLFDKVFQKEEMKVNDMRDAFFDAHGGWAALQKQLASLSNQDLVKKIFDAKTVEQFNAAVREAEGLLGLQSEAQQKLQEAIDKYGFSIDELGPKFQQQKLDEMAGALLQDYKLLTASGIEQNTVLAKMGPAFQDYVNTALKAGAALPETMRPIIEQLIQSGQLLDENGNAFTSLEQSGISFTQTLSEGLQSLISKIDELVRALTGAGSAAGRISIPNGGSLGNGKGLEEQPRSFAGGSGGFQNFGSGTPAVLHGVEAVIRPGDLRSIGGPNVTYAPVITVYGAGNADEIRDVVMTSLRDNADGMRDFVASVAR